MGGWISWEYSQLNPTWAWSLAELGNKNIALTAVYFCPLNQLFPGFFGNLLTLVAIPYVRKVYGAQFSILQLNSVVLILHLSLAELLITVVSIPAGRYLTSYKLVFYQTLMWIVHFMFCLRKYIMYWDRKNMKHIIFFSRLLHGNPNKCMRKILFP